MDEVDEHTKNRLKPNEKPVKTRLKLVFWRCRLRSVARIKTWRWGGTGRRGWTVSSVTKEAVNDEQNYDHVAQDLKK